MGVSILDNWQYLGKKPDFTRQLFETVADMVAFNENYLAPVYECNVIEDGCRYRYQLTNDLDPDLGRWRKVEGGSGIIKFLDQQEMDDYLVGGKATVGDICFLDEKFYEIELDTNGDLAYNELLFLTETDREILDSLEIEELKEDALDPDLVTGYVLKYRGKQLFTEDDLCVENIDFTQW